MARSNGVAILEPSLAMGAGNPNGPDCGRMDGNMDPDAGKPYGGAWMVPQDGGEPYPVDVPPIVEVLFAAVFLSERENAPEIGVSHLLAALDTSLNEPITVQPRGPYSPVPHQDKNLSAEAAAVIGAACARAGCDLEHLTKDALRAALLAAVEDRGA